MATEYLFSNNATTTLAQSVSATATVLNVASGDGALFPSPASGQAFAVTLVDAATGLTNEICYCTSRSGDQLTVTRGQEGTNATSWLAGDTCANYITADVMESWLQESDLNGYATEVWANSKYIQIATGNTDYSPLQGGVNKTSGEMWFSYADASGTIKYAFAQPAGDYATNTALNNETTRATTVESNLQTSVGQKVNRSGDKMTGGLTIESYGGVTASISPSSANTGDFINYPSFYSVASGRGGQAVFGLQEHVGTTFTLLLSLQFSDGSWRYVGWSQNKRINDSQYGDVAYTSDLPTSGTITGGTYTKIGNVLTQAFTIYVPSNGTNSHRISYPMAFSGSSTATFNLTDTGQSRSVSLSENTQPDASGFNIAVSVHGNSTAGSTDGLTLTVIAQGLAA